MRIIDARNQPAPKIDAIHRQYPPRFYRQIGITHAHRETTDADIKEFRERAEKEGAVAIFISNYGQSAYIPLKDAPPPPVVPQTTSKKPFIKVGDRVRFIGSSRSRFERWPEGKWLEYGVTGTVTEYHPESPAVTIKGEYFEGLAQYAVVRWDLGGTADTAIDPEDEGTRWERIGGKTRVPSMADKLFGRYQRPLPDEAY